MGFLDIFTGKQAEIMRQPALASPWSSSELTKVVIANDVFGQDAAIVSREAALRVPAVARCRDLIVGAVSPLPLVAFDATGELAEQPTWLYRTNGPISPALRMASTVDQLIFNGSALWAIERGYGGAILNAQCVPAESWRFDSDGHILINESRVSEDTVILIPGLTPGVLTHGADSIGTAKRLERSAEQRANSPIPAVELHATEDIEVTEAEAEALVASYVKARQNPHGAVMYTPYGIDFRPHGQAASDLLIEARNSSAVDIARLFGVPAGLIDASGVNSTLTYETVQGRNLQFREQTLAPYLTAIESRLSQDDCVPRGTRVRFDTTSLTTQYSVTSPGKD